MDLTQQFLVDVQKNGNNKVILEKLPYLGLSDCWLVTGGLFQTIWNLKSGRPTEENIKDYDILYFDKDTSYEAEDKIIKRVLPIFDNLNIKVELRNQARVPIWYKEKFGVDYPAVYSARDNIARFLFCCNCVGITYKNDDLELYAPFGVEDIYEGILRPNKSVLSFNSLGKFDRKADKYKARWPWLKLVE